MVFAFNTSHPETVNFIFSHRRETSHHSNVCLKTKRGAHILHLTKLRESREIVGKTLLKLLFHSKWVRIYRFPTELYISIPVPGIRKVGLKYFHMWNLVEIKKSQELLGFTHEPAINFSLKILPSIRAVEKASLLYFS